MEHLFQIPQDQLYRGRLKSLIASNRVLVCLGLTGSEMRESLM